MKEKTNSIKLRYLKAWINFRTIFYFAIFIILLGKSINYIFYNSLDEKNKFSQIIFSQNLSALGTILAVIVALFKDEFIKHLNKVNSIFIKQYAKYEAPFFNYFIEFGNLNKNTPLLDCKIFIEKIENTNINSLVYFVNQNSKRDIKQNSWSTDIIDNSVFEFIELNLINIKNPFIINLKFQGNFEISNDFFSNKELDFIVYIQSPNLTKILKYLFKIKLNEDKLKKYNSIYKELINYEYDFNEDKAELKKIINISFKKLN